VARASPRTLPALNSAARSRPEATAGLGDSEPAPCVVAAYDNDQTGTIGACRGRGRHHGGAEELLQPGGGLRVLAARPVIDDGLGRDRNPGAVCDRQPEGTEDPAQPGLDVAGAGGRIDELDRCALIEGSSIDEGVREDGVPGLVAGVFGAECERVGCAAA